MSISHIFMLMVYFHIFVVRTVRYICCDYNILISENQTKLAKYIKIVLKCLYTMCLS